MTVLGIRQSVQALQQQYKHGNKKPLSDVVRAWKGIQELPPDDPRSFFVLGGYHGEPFLLRNDVDKLSETDRYAYWGGYCNHGNVLFPTWHRVYVRKLEEALQSVVPGVMMPYWDETDVETLTDGIPWVLTDDIFVLDDGTKIDPNPLKSFVLPAEILDGYWGDNINGAHGPYYKPKGYETVRYPLSGLVGSPEAKANTEAHNAQYTDKGSAEITAKLNFNVKAWLVGGDPTPSDPHPTGTGVYALYRACLNAPNYTVFSNTTSMEAWNNGGNPHAVALEDPHNDVHLAIGGFDLPMPQFGGPKSTTGQVSGANGDMGENNTAALDPIFFFHHANVDRMFWLWQQQNPDKKVEIINGYAGSNSDDSQGPTPGIPPGTALSMDSPLAPFKKEDGTPYTSNDCIDTTAMGYTYGAGSFDDPALDLLGDGDQLEGGSNKVLVVRGLNRGRLPGSFVVSAVARISQPDGSANDRYLGHHSVLSRWNIEGCKNCQTHLDVVSRFPLTMLTDDEVDHATFSAHISHRGIEDPDDTLGYSVES